jgi:hypothetical protein
MAYHLGTSWVNSGRVEGVVIRYLHGRSIYLLHQQYEMVLVLLNQHLDLVQGVHREEGELVWVEDLLGDPLLVGDLLDLGLDHQEGDLEGQGVLECVVGLLGQEVLRVVQRWGAVQLHSLILFALVHTSLCSNIMQHTSWWATRYRTATTSSTRWTCWAWCSFTRQFRNSSSEHSTSTSTSSSTSTTTCVLC